MLYFFGCNNKETSLFFDAQQYNIPYLLKKDFLLHFFPPFFAVVFNGFSSAALVYSYFAIYTKCICILNIFKKRFSFFRQNETFLFGRPPAEIRVIMKWERRFVFILSKQSITSPRSRLFRRPANILKATTKIAILRRRTTDGHKFLKSPDQKKKNTLNEMKSISRNVISE